MNNILEIENLKVSFSTEEGIVRAVNGISLSLKKGETLGLVGESGCGKSVTSLAVLGLIPDPPGRIDSGAVSFKGRTLTGSSQKEYSKIRGKEIAMIFQEPMTALNPVFTCGWQIEEALKLHTDLNKAERKAKAADLLETVGIADPVRRLDSYPHELSGGMRQRIMIAMALACGPDLLIADEPTTALDVTIQAQILELIRRMQEKFGMAMILITHDLAVVAETVNKVAVMYAGYIVELADVRILFSRPLHPYTQGLLDSIPILGKADRKLKPIQGRVPSLIDPEPGCPFANRCPKVQQICREKLPELTIKPDGSQVRCYFA